MSDETFLHRWSRLKRAAVGDSPVEDNLKSTPPQAAGKALDTDQPAAPTLTMADIALLGPDADYAPFMAKSVDQAVQRAALKNLFADPRFNVIDRLDIYMDDYNIASPLPLAMLRNLQHASELLARGVELEARMAAAAALPPTDETSV